MQMENTACFLLTNAGSRTRSRVVILPQIRLAVQARIDKPVLFDYNCGVS